MSQKNTMNKNTIPEGFTIPMALMDLLPVAFFGGTGILLAIILSNLFVGISAGVIFLSGLVKAIWKMIVVLKRKNIWPMFVQMRILMPLGFLALLGGVIFSLATSNGAYDLSKLVQFPQILFFILGILGLAGMIICSLKLDSADPKSNWIEQTINSFAQGFVFLGFLLLILL